MACPKVNPNYPNTATLIERPISVLIRRLDRDFDKAKAFDLAYDYPKRKFYENALLHGAYAVVVPDGESLESAFKHANGFCDPYDDGTVFTGTGAGGANPGSVPSIGPNAGVPFYGGDPARPFLTTEDGSFILTEDGQYIRIT